MASYLGASYQAAVGPTDRDVTLFAAPPPPQEHGFSPVPGGIWRKQVRVDELEALWESRPIGSYHGEPCLVLDDLGDRLHVAYLGMDERRAGQLGYWQVDRGVFEVVVARHEVTDLAEERHEFPIALLLSALPRALSAGGNGTSSAGNGRGGPERTGGPERMALGSGQVAAWNGQPMTGSYQTAAPGLRLSGPQQAGPPQSGPPQSPPGTQQPPFGQPQLAPAPQLQTYQVPAGRQPLPAASTPQPTGGAGQQQVTGRYHRPSGPQPAMPQHSMPQYSVPQSPAGLAGGPGAVPGSQHVPMPPSVQMPGGMPPAGQQQTFFAPPGSPPQAQPGMGQPGQAQPPQAQPYQEYQEYQTPTQAPAAQSQQAIGPPRLPYAQPPAAVAAWHGSPAPDGNGTWYFQPANTDPQQNGQAQNGQAQNGQAQNGQAQNGTAQNGTVQNGMNGYAPPGPGPAQPVPGPSYQPGAPPQQAAPAQPGEIQPPQQLPQYAQAPAAMEQYQIAPAAAQPVAQPAPQAQFPLAATMNFAGSAAPAQAAPAMNASPLSAPPMTALASPADLTTTGPLAPAPEAEQPAQGPQADQPPALSGSAGGALSKLTGAVRGRRAARKPRLAMSANFADLVDLAHLPRSAYAVDEEVTGAMCLFKTDGGYEVFSCAADARHEVRFFEDEEAAYFYLFGVLAAEALRSGRLTPRRG